MDTTRSTSARRRRCVLFSLNPGLKCSRELDVCTMYRVLTSQGGRRTPVPLSRLAVRAGPLPLSEEPPLLAISAARYLLGTEGT